MNATNSLPFIFQHFWLLFIAAVFANAAIWWSRRRQAVNPALERGYRRLIGRFLILGSIPWLILGAAFELADAFPALSRDLSVAFALTIPVYLIALFYWLFFAGGAEYLAAHPGLLMGDVRDPETVKNQFLAVVGILFVMLVFAWLRFPH